MKTSKIKILLLCFLLQGQSQIFTINLKQVLTAGLLASTAKSECTVYNTTPKKIIIENSHYDFLLELIFKDYKAPESTTTIPAGEHRDIENCIRLDVIYDDSEVKVSGLSRSDQPHGKPFQAFTLTQEPCYTDCQGVMTQINLVPGLPESYFSDIKSLSKKELKYAAHQLEYHTDTITHDCNLRGTKLARHKKRRY